MTVRCKCKKPVIVGTDGIGHWCSCQGYIPPQNHPKYTFDDDKGSVTLRMEECVHCGRMVLYAKLKEGLCEDCADLRKALIQALR